MAAIRFESSAPSRLQCWWMKEERERRGLGERNEGLGKSIGRERRGELWLSASSVDDVKEFLCAHPRFLSTHALKL